MAASRSLTSQAFRVVPGMILGFGITLRSTKPSNVVGLTDA
ncbi:hypothetical protein ACVWXL_008978 [Bradyrhizobium sp. GM22.5]